MHSDPLALQNVFSQQVSGLDEARGGQVLPQLTGEREKQERWFPAVRALASRPAPPELAAQGENSGQATLRPGRASRSPPTVPLRNASATCSGPPVSGLRLRQCPGGTTAVPTPGAGTRGTHHDSSLVFVY